LHISLERKVDGIVQKKGVVPVNRSSNCPCGMARKHSYNLWSSKTNTVDATSHSGFADSTI